ncbi:DUF4389 domain-containing protein [Pararhodobacter oceanensis]|nr:DUF4389 domain-containing protein [Pararhodobacter oceanensis]
MAQRDDQHPHLDEEEEGFDPGPRELWPRILWIIVITLMISGAQSILLAVAALQVLIMIANKGQPNEELGDFGSMVGAWVAKAARYQSAASDQKPWPWTPMGS